MAILTIIQLRVSLDTCVKIVYSIQFSFFYRQDINNT